MADISVEVRLALTEVVYDELINSVLRMLGKLDLTSQSSTEVAQQQEVLIILIAELCIENKLYHL